MTPEGLAKKEIIEGLNALGIRFLRLQSGRVRVRGGMMHLCPTGTPDMILFDREGVLIWCEIKAAFGKRSPEQEDFAAWADSVGHRYALVRSFSDVLAALKGIS